MIILSTGIILIGMGIAGLVYSFLNRKEEGKIRLRPEEKTKPSFLILFLPLLKKIGSLNAGILGFKERKKDLEQKLALAEVPEGLGAEEFLALQEAGAVGLPFILWLALGSLNLSLSLALLVFGFILPYLWLNDRVKVREKKIIRELPGVLDLLTLSVEAGLDFTAALSRIVQKARPSPLREEFNYMLNELKMGKTRREALDSMGKRAGVPEMVHFCTALVQADELGTGLGQVLRIQAEELRVKRMQRAEKLAMEAPVKLLLPLLGFVFPAVMLIMFGPIILSGIF